MPIISRLAAEESGALGLDASTEVQGFIVSVLSGGDPRTETGVPQRGTIIDPAQPTMLVDSVEKTEFIRRDGGLDYWKVRCLCSTDRRFAGAPRPNEEENEWGFTSSVRTLAIPTFERQRRAYKATAGQITQYADQWDPKPYLLEVTFAVLERTVFLSSVDWPELTYIDNQVNVIHVFQGRIWKMLPANIRQLHANKVRIVYGWESDPGNGPLTDDQQQPDYIAPDFNRLPFERYRVRPAQVEGERPFLFPQVVYFNQPSPPPRPNLPGWYPPGAAFINKNHVQPNAWQNLPGNPLG
jgi:hypothetical protein